jgi:glucosamine 6-phosphate synthetase-like amidotransferase/phosphosugar isomerase protein
MESVKKTIENDLHGKWGLVCIDKNDPKKIIVARNGSPILVGLH